MEDKKLALVSARVENGMQLLDRVYPGWEKKVNLETLDIMSCRHCILGQLYGDYDDGVRWVGISKHSAHEFGFVEQGEIWFNDLTSMWAEKITARLAA
jgi:hypothetical protein